MTETVVIVIFLGISLIIVFYLVKWIIKKRQQMEEFYRVTDSHNQFSGTRIFPFVQQPDIEL